jgi:hypothetical protein
MFILLFTVGLNIPYWFACHFLDLLPIGWFSIESLLAGLVVLFVSRTLGAILLLLFFAEDILCAVSKTYYLTPFECISHVHSLSAFAPARLAEMLLAILLAISFFLFMVFVPVSLLKTRKQRVLAAAGIVLFGCLGVTVDSLTIRSVIGRFANPINGAFTGEENRFTHYDSLWFFRYAPLRLRTASIIFAATPKNQAARQFSDYAKLASASAAALSQLRLSDDRSESRPNIVLVVVESWGLFEDRRSQQLFENIYATPDLSKKYQIQFGKVPFHGSTVNGEVRELCGSNLGFDVERAPARELTSCLPARLDALGYSTTAAHGMVRYMFLRDDWYRNLGFEDIWFRNRFKQNHFPECVGAFRGICDSAIASWMTKELQASTSPQFFYWMTLNAHLPLPVPSGVSDPASCSPLRAVTAPFCSWYQIEAKLHQSIAAMAGAVRRPSVFIVVGDHAPPFSNMEVRSQFSQQDVPYVLLLPKEQRVATPQR